MLPCHNQGILERVPGLLYCSCRRKGGRKRYFVEEPNDQSEQLCRLQKPLHHRKYPEPNLTDRSED